MDIELSCRDSSRGAAPLGPRPRSTMNEIMEKPKTAMTLWVGKWHCTSGRFLVVWGAT